MKRCRAIWLGLKAPYCECSALVCNCISKDMACLQTHAVRPRSSPSVSAEEAHVLVRLPRCASLGTRQLRMRDAFTKSQNTHTRGRRMPYMKSISMETHLAMLQM